MKRTLSMLLAVILLLTCVFVASPQTRAAEKAEDPRTIAIVFDNSGSMYKDQKMDWCRATYAMEVFASMLNKGDKLMIYPMWPIEVGDKQYTMRDPMVITDATESSAIREIYTPVPGGTPVESIDCALDGLRKDAARKKYLVVLTDGDVFYKDSKPLDPMDADGNLIGTNAVNTKKELDARFDANAGKNMTIMFLGIGEKAQMPTKADSEYFKKIHTPNSEDVLSALTDMCNLIFGRDILPKGDYVDENAKTINFGMSMKKLIVFAQGKNISDLKIKNESGPTGEETGRTTTKYSTEGCDKNAKGEIIEEVADTNLQGMVVTYENCPSGTYSFSYSGDVESIEFYYEPDVDLYFEFTDADGSKVDNDALYEGTYTVRFGMLDAQTKKPITDDKTVPLLGTIKYSGSYSVTDKATGETKTTTFGEDVAGPEGTVSIDLKMGDKFEAELSVIYLSGYPLHKDSTEFGWPEGGIEIAPRPAGNLTLEISGGQDQYSVKTLESGEPYIIKAFFKPNDGEKRQLTGADLKQIFDTLDWDADISNALLKPELADDHIKLKLAYKDPAAPQNTVDGECALELRSSYTAPGSNPVQEITPFSYKINADKDELEAEMIIVQDYLVIGELEESQEIIIKLTINGKDLTAEQFSRLQNARVTTDINHDALVADQSQSCYKLKLRASDGIAEGDYSIKFQVDYADEIGRPSDADDGTVETYVTLSSMPLWLKWVIFLGGLLLLCLLIWAILHIPAMPKKVSSSGKKCSLKIGGVDAKGSPSYPTERSGKTLSILCKKGTRQFGVKMPVAPGDGSYLYMPSRDRTMKVIAKDVMVVQGGNIKVTEANIGKKFVIDPKTKKLVPANPRDVNSVITLTNNKTITFTGKISENGSEKSFTASVKIDFTNK